MPIRLPAEWEPQSAVLLTWPHAEGDFGPDYQHVEPTFTGIAHAIAQHQTVIITAKDQAHQQDIEHKLLAQHTNLNNIKFYLTPSNDVWARDHGPITIYENHHAVQCDFIFNAWGQKYASDLDDQLPAKLFAAKLIPGYEYRRINFILEGGAIETDGQGTLLTTTQCLLNKHRNSELSQSQIEQKLREYLGISRVIWLDHGHLVGDDTDSHIDTLARFLNPTTIAYVQCQDPNDSQYESLKAMEDQLRTFRDNAEQPYQLIPLPLPAPVFNKKGERLPAAYANFLITNSQVLVPTYQDPQDEVVLKIFQAHFPTRKIIGINCRTVIEEHGSLHCLTMQIAIQGTSS